MKRLDTEFTLSQEAIVKGAEAKREQHIISVWSSWYETALKKMNDISISGETPTVRKKIAEAVEQVKTKSKDLITSLK
jgi:hypothetical protein